MSGQKQGGAERSAMERDQDWGFSLDHVNIRTADVDRLAAFYERTLGLKRGARPPFEFPGAWLYAGERAVVHLVNVGGRPKAPEEASGLRLEHFALLAAPGMALADFLAHLERLGVKSRVVPLPDGSATQVNIWDPDGNHLHLDFAPEGQA